MALLIDLFAGLGLSLIGVKLIASHLIQLSGPLFKRLIDRATQKPVNAAMLGLLSGALTQSSGATTIIAISTVTACLVDVVRIIPVVTWSNVGTSVLVILSSIDISHAILLLLGMTGLAYYFDAEKMPKVRHVLGTFLGIGLLFLGLDMFISKAAPLKSMQSVRDFLHFSAQFDIMSFAIGAAFAVVAQSSGMVTIIVATMNTADILTTHQTIIIVIGASLGSGIATLLLTANLTGIGRQIGYLQAAIKALGLVVTLPLFALWIHGLIPWSARVAIAIDGSMQVALVYLFMQTVSAILGSLFQQPLIAWAAKLSPPTIEESLERPRYLYTEGLSDPRTALDLVEKEQSRLFAYLPGIIDAVRPDCVVETAPGVLAAANLAVAQRCDQFLTEILDTSDSREVTVGVVGAQKRNEILIALIGSSRDYTAAVASAGERSDGDKLGRLVFALNESLHMILLAANDAVASRDEIDMQVLFELTSDRSTQMEQIRRQVMEVGAINPRDHNALYATTTLFERTLWLTRRYVSLFQRGQSETEH